MAGVDVDEDETQAHPPSAGLDLFVTEVARLLARRMIEAFDAEMAARSTPAASDLDELITVAAAAELLGVSPKTLYNWALHSRHTEVLPVIKIGRQSRYRLGDVLAFRRSGTKGP